jgi:glycosyltransferase involved in cell wall biosynthesis
MASFGPGYPPWQDRLYRKIERRLSAVTDSYAVVGHDLARRYASIGVPTEKLSVVRSGVPLPSNSPDPAERVATRAGLGLPIGRPVVLSIGSLDSRKNVLLLPQLMEAVHHLVPMDIAPYLAVAGEGPLRERLIRSIEASGLSADACLLGYVTEPNHLIACVDVVVLLSRAEGVSQVLVQAAAAGTPFVAFDVDGVNELLRLGATGACVSFGSVSEAAAAVAKEIVDRPVASTPPDLSSWDRDQIRSAYRELVGRILPDLREIPEDKIA